MVVQTKDTLQHLISTLCKWLSKLCCNIGVYIITQGCRSLVANVLGLGRLLIVFLCWDPFHNEIINSSNFELNAIAYGNLLVTSLLFSSLRRLKQLD